MATTKKITKKERFNELIAMVSDRTDLVEFLNHEIELLDKKASTKTQTKTQKENESFKELIVNVLRNGAKPMTITDIQENDSTLATLSNQKISALLTQLKNDNVIVKVVDKKKAYFSISE
jgi:hypothetical protein